MVSNELHKGQKRAVSYVLWFKKADNYIYCLSKGTEHCPSIWTQRVRTTDVDHGCRRLEI